jgi:flagellar motility protein MotE (MotC chaperone)
MTRSFRALPLLIFLAAPASAIANEEPSGVERKTAAQPEPRLPGVKQVPIRKPALPPPKPVATDGMKGVESFCGAIASSAASARLAWQESRIKTLQGELAAKTAELDAKIEEVRQWVLRREELLAKASDNLTSIFAKMSPEAASAQLQAMDDDTAAALLLKLKPAIASAVMNEMDPARAARLSDLLTGASAKSNGKKS